MKAGMGLRDIITTDTEELRKKAEKAAYRHGVNVGLSIMLAASIIAIIVITALK